MAMARRMRLLGSALLIAATASQGCAYFRPTGSVPTLVDRATTKADPAAKPTWENPTDQVVLRFTNDVKTAMRERMGTSRMARLFSGTFQVLSAATAAALGATTGNLTAITALAGASAVTPNIQEIFDARAAAEAYRHGVELVERAEGRYFSVRARRVARDRTGQTKLVPDNEFTVDAANLYRQTVASIRVLERTLVAQLPTIEDLRRAVGELNETFDEIDDEAHRLNVSPSKISLRVDDQAAVLILTPDNLVTLVSADRPDVVTATLGTGAHSVTIKGVGPGSARVTAVSDKGLRALVDVKVRSRESHDIALMAPETVTAGESFAFVAAGATPTAEAIPTNALTVMIELRGTGGGDQPVFESLVGADWTCSALPQPTVRCQPAAAIAARSLAPHLRLSVKVPADYGRHDLKIVTEVVTKGQQTLTETVSVVPRHRMTLAVTREDGTIAVGSPMASNVTLTNAGPSEATNLALELTVAGPATIEAPTALSGWQCGAPQTNATTVKCTRDRAAVGATGALRVPVKPSGSGTVTIKADVKAAVGGVVSATTTTVVP